MKCVFSNQSYNSYFIGKFVDVKISGLHFARCVHNLCVCKLINPLSQLFNFVNLLDIFISLNSLSCKICAALCIFMSSPKQSSTTNTFWYKNTEFIQLDTQRGCNLYCYKFYASNEGKIWGKYQWAISFI